MLKINAIESEEERAKFIEQKEQEYRDIFAILIRQKHGYTMML